MKTSHIFIFLSFIHITITINRIDFQLDPMHWNKFKMNLHCPEVLNVAMFILAERHRARGGAGLRGGLQHAEAHRRLGGRGGGSGGGSGGGLEVELEAGLLPSAWRSLDRVSCNSSYDRWGTGHLAWGGANMIPRSQSP